MPMMRRGPLDRYTPEWVLRQANAHGAEGSIEFHTDEPITLYLHGGKAYAAEAGVNLSETDLARRPPVPEHAARDHLVGLLAGVMGAQSGWYFHDPLGQHPSRGAWTWETATLLMDVRARTHQTRTLASWTDRTVALLDTGAGSVTLGPDAWAVVVQLAGSATAGELRLSLGWSPDRVASALTEIEDHRLLESTPILPVPAAPPTGLAAPRPLPPPPRPAPPADLPSGLPPNVPALGQRRGASSGAGSSALRRVMPGRRPGP